MRYPIIKAQSFKPPKDVAEAAQQGLDLRDEYNRGGTDVGIARARDLSNRRPVSLETIQRMSSFFARHEDNKNTDPEDGNGKIAWLLWGGDPGKRWADSILKRVEKAANKQGAMIAIIPPKRVREAFYVVGGEDRADLHITLAYLGMNEDLPDDVEDLVQNALRVLEDFDPIRVGFSGVGRFQSVGEGEDAVVAIVDAPGIQELRMRLCDALDDAGIEVMQNHSFTPHMTLAYVSEREQLPVQSLDELSFRASKICLVREEKVRGRYKLGEPIEKATISEGDLDGGGRLEPDVVEEEKKIVERDGEYCVIGESGKNFGCYADKKDAEERLNQISRFSEKEKGDYDFESRFPILKTKEERYVMGIVLEPEVVDAHNDIISAEAIKKTAHRFLANYNRKTEMGLQHQRLGDIGVLLVESYIAPISFMMNGELVRKGSWVMAAYVEDDQTWQAIKAGRITGFSVAGMAQVGNG